MKRLIVSLVFALTVFANTSSVTAFERWKFQMFEPSATTQRTLNIEYKVLSIDAEDTFTIKLYQNDLEVASQNVTTDYGDSGVFITSIPASGTYTYKTTALNGAEEKSQTRTVQISDSPQPIVTIVNTATTGAAGNQAGTNAGGTNVGQVSDKAATTNKATKDVLGADTKKDDNKSRRNTVGVILLLFAAAGGYYYITMRKTTKD